MVKAGGTVTIVVNGGSAAGGSQSSSAGQPQTLVANSQELWIGGRPLLSQYFEGKIDDVRVWNRTLDPTEIASNRFTPIGGTSSGLVAYYQLNEGAGTSGTNLAAATAAIDGALLNGATWSDTGHPSLEGASPSSGSAGVTTATMTLTAADPDGPLPSYGTTGWTAAGTNLFSRAGTYGLATLNTLTGLVSYTLNNSLDTTQG